MKVIYQMQILNYEILNDRDLKIEFCNIGEEDLPSTSWFTVPEEYRYLLDRGLVGIYEIFDKRRRGELTEQ